MLAHWNGGELSVTTKGWKVAQLKVVVDDSLAEELVDLAGT
jgi:hypothetical protein